MKVFISWSGPLSRRLGEALRDWLPGVLQLVTPYFTPSDIEKGTRWSSDIAKELSVSQVGILCITRDNLHSDWVLFEAGALSRSLEKSHVCPVLFGITNSDLAGPLKQFQTTEFDKADFRRLVGVINGRLADHKLPEKTLETVFEKWWPDLEAKIGEILAGQAEPDEPVRTDRELLEEILQLSRASTRRTTRFAIAPAAVQDILERFVSLHDEQVSRSGGYQETLNAMRGMHKALDHIAMRYAGSSEELDELIARFRQSSYTVAEEDGASDDDVPF